MSDAKCKICRRLGVKLFLKGQKCLGPKCPMVKRAYPPGQKRKRRGSLSSEYGKELREKQKLARWYNLRERQFRNYVSKILKKRRNIKEDLGEILIRSLEKRLDNVIFRAGFAESRAQAKQMVSHAHFLVNNKHVNIPSYEVKKGDIITICDSSKNKTIFKSIPQKIKEYNPPSWIDLDKKDLKIKIVGEPSLLESSPPVESISKIFEFYSK